MLSEELELLELKYGRIYEDHILFSSNRGMGSLAGLIIFNVTLVAASMLRRAVIRANLDATIVSTKLIKD